MFYYPIQPHLKINPKKSLYYDYDSYRGCGTVSEHVVVKEPYQGLWMFVCMNQITPEVPLGHAS